MKLNINNCTVQANLYNHNHPEGEFLCDEEVKITSCNGLSFIENTMLLSKGSVINKNSDFSSEDLTGYDFTINQWSNPYELSTSYFHTGNKSLKVSGGSEKYITFETEKFNVSRYKKMLGNILFYIDSENESESINTTLTLKYFDKDDNELIDSKLILNRDYTYSETKKFVLLPSAISNGNVLINIPNEAISACLRMTFGNLNNDIYIDNISIIGI